MITHVAIWYKGRIYSLPKPNRHFNIIKLIHEQTGDFSIRGWQGFLDHTGKFLGRKEALKIALKNKQVLDARNIRAGILFSEDLW